MKEGKNLGSLIKMVLKNFLRLKNPYNIICFITLKIDLDLSSMALYQKLRISSNSSLPRLPLLTSRAASSRSAIFLSVFLMGLFQKCPLEYLMLTE